MMEPETEDNRVGYGRPPKECQFQPGQSGNPAGRPKEEKTSVNRRIMRRLHSLTEAREHDTRIVLSKKRAIVRRIIKRALEGDARAAAMVLARARALAPKETEKIVVIADKKYSASENGAAEKARPEDQSE